MIQRVHCGMGMNSAAINGAFAIPLVPIAVLVVLSIVIQSRHYFGRDSLFCSEISP